MTDLYELTEGFHPGQRIVIASRPVVGRSTVARRLAETYGGVLWDHEVWRTPPVSNLPTFATYRLPRSVERLPLARPTLANVAPTVAEYANIVLLLYRRSFYDIDAPRGRMEIIVAKSPRGTGSLSVRFDPFPLVPVVR